MVALQISNVFKEVILGLPFVSLLQFSNVLPLKLFIEGLFLYNLRFSLSCKNFAGLHG